MIKGHTPGPWITAGEQPGQVWVDHSGLTVAIATVSTNGQDSITAIEMKANAHLIAAAPDLFGALMNIMSWVQLDMIEMQREGHTVKHLAAACDLAQTAINKAKGEGS